MNHPHIRNWGFSDTPLLLPYYLPPGTVLPSTISGQAVEWKSSQPDVWAGPGRLVSPVDELGPEIQLTAVTLKESYTYKVRMLGERSCWLAGYTREPDENANVYSLFVANSLHLALDMTGEGYEALNDNYGVLFAKADYYHSVQGETRLLGMPRCFRLTDGGFGILATPLNHEGKGDRPGELLYFETKDFVHYKEKEHIVLSSKVILDYSCELDAATRLYRIGWKDEGGESYFGMTKDFITLVDCQPGEGFPVQLQELSMKGALTGQRIALTRSEATYLKNKLGRVCNVSVSVPVIELQAGDPLPDHWRVTTVYSDGSVNEKRLIIDPAALATVNLSQPGTYKLDGEVLRHRFPYPMMMTRPDPQIIRLNNRYYFISTDDDGQRRIYIRSADTLEGLQDGQAAETLLWDGTLPDGERRGEHWAPELHLIHGRLYCFLAISVNNSWTGVQAHVAVLTGNDPLNRDHWETPLRVLDRHGKVLGDLAERERNINLDMTYFEYGGQSYVCWSQPKWHKEVQELASLYIATVDPDMPWRLTSDPVKICQNEYGWDRNGKVASGVAEGPYVLKHEDAVYMVYSGSSVGPTYTVGMLELIKAGDPLNPAAWRKSNYPWMHSLSHPGQYGPGHNSFVQDEDGNWFNVYHACEVNGGFRHASIRPVHFRSDGSPVLDMTEEEELLPEYERLTIIVVVQ
ncbi:family 43 glycosylhydrolase [Paenibacillus sp. FSL P2-0089]|uniref:family 43 glycosylhydrolase n=1 Tax=Paenibacillus sp. FSL P2-0089 TaxID=2954526 RepID=UPI003159D0AB